VKDVKSFLTAVILVAVATLISGCSKDDTPEPVRDIDGNIYKTVRIGTQVWMAENLKTTRFNDGTEIKEVVSKESWANLSAEGYCWYDNDAETYKDTYGALYSGYTVGAGELCPAGWHIPLREDWQKLIEFLSDTITGGNSLKIKGSQHWPSSDISADNSTGFSALPSGIRYFEGTFSSINTFTSFWSGTEPGKNDLWYISLYSGSSVVSMRHISKKYGFSVRCVKEQDN
jgi:uncharacterized protein (TIGR02145 family)